MTVRAIVVEDETIPRRLLCSLVAEVDWIELVGQAADGTTALELIDAQEPDLIFLDIMLPGLSGIDVLEHIGPGRAVVFTTGHEGFAIRALQLGAVDYLLKPFGREQFMTAMTRVHARLQAPRAEAAPQIARPATPWKRDRIYVRNGDVMVPLKLGDIERVEARGDYSMISIGGRVWTAHLSLGEIEGMLDPSIFARVHRSHIVNLECVTSLRQLDGRRFIVALKDGFEITASREGTRMLRNLVI